MHSQRAAVFLELMTSILLGSVILAALVSALRVSVSLHGKSRAVYGDTSTELRLRGIVRSIASDIDLHRFEILPRIQSGMLRFVSGEANPAGQISPDSNALTYLSLDVSRTQRIIWRRTGGAATIYYACSRFGNKMSPGDYSGYLGIGIAGFIELDGSAGRADDGVCRQFRLSAQRSMLFAQSEEVEAAITQLVPIRNLYTYYLNTKRELRYLGHRAGRNIENQPLLEGISMLRFSLQELIPGEIFALGLDARTLRGDQFAYGWPHSLGREPFFNFLLNR